MKVSAWGAFGLGVLICAVLAMFEIVRDCFISVFGYEVVVTIMVLLPLPVMWLMIFPPRWMR